MKRKELPVYRSSIRQVCCLPVADAAESESSGDFLNARETPTAAKVDIQKIEIRPDLPPITPDTLLHFSMNMPAECRIM